MVKIAITFDYELFLGKNYYSAEDILFNSTNELSNLLEKNGVRGTFFADMCSRTAHKKYKLNDYVTSFDEQLKSLRKNGHDVQLHIHPNWLLSEYRESEWIFDTTHYRIHSLGVDINDKDGMYALIKNEIDNLNEIMLSVDPAYKCVAYRAGGYSLQPHSDLCKCLRHYGIMIDSSVCRKCSCDSSANKYDFRKLPNSFNWWLTPEKDFCHKGSMNEGGLFEVPLTSYRNSIVYRIFHPSEKSGLPVAPLKGEFVKIVENENKKISLLKAICNYGKPQLASLDSAKWVDIIKSLKKAEHVCNRKEKRDIYVALICHPKLCNEYVLQNLQELIDNIKVEPDKYEFVTMRDIYDKICD